MTVVNLKLVENVSTVKKQIITMVASGKGGVGRTWFSIALANELGKQGKKVLLIDGDLSMANVDIQLGIMPRRDLGHFLQNQESLKDVICEFPEGKFDVIIGRSGSAQLSDLPEIMLDVLANEIREVALDYDYLIIDTGSSMSEAMRSFAQIANKCMMVLTCEPTSIINAYSLIKAIKPFNNNLKFEMVINQADSDVDAEQTYQVLSNICQKFLEVDPVLAGVVEKDDSVKYSIQNQTMHSLRNPMSKALENVRTLARQM